MPWTVPITTEDGTTFPVHFDGDAEPTQDEIDYAGHQLIASQQGDPSVLGSFARSAARNVLPTAVGGRLGAMAGGAAGGALEGAIAGSEVPVVGNIVGGLIGAAGGMYLASKGQEALANAVDPSASNPFSTASEQADVEANPYSTMVGGLLAAGKPSLSTLQNAIKSTATAEGRNLLRQGFTIAKQMAGAASEKEAQELAAQNPAAVKVFSDATSVGGNVGIGAAQGAVQGESPMQILKGAAGGALFNQGWGHGGEAHKTPPAEPAPEDQKNNVVADFATQTADSLEQQSAGTSPTAEVLRNMTAAVDLHKVSEAATLAPEPEEPANENQASITGTEPNLGENPSPNPEVRTEAQPQEETPLNVGGEEGPSPAPEPQEDAEQLPETPEPDASPPPDTTTIKDFDSYGKLAKDVELPHDESIRSLSLRKKYLEMLRDCVGG